jgi:hypothetical protein
MNSLTQVMPMVSTVSRGTVLKRLFVIGYLTATVVATLGWVSALGWAAVRLASWLMA